jgi:hypothetical protein
VSGCAEENQSKLWALVPASVVEMACGSHCAVEEQLRPGIPQQAFTAQVHVCCKVKLVDWLWIVWIGGNQANTVLSKPISIDSATVTCYIQCDYCDITCYITGVYNIVHNMLYSIVYNMLYHVIKHVCYAHPDQRGSNWPLVCPCNHLSPIVE